MDTEQSPQRGLAQWYPLSMNLPKCPVKLNGYGLAGLSALGSQGLQAHTTVPRESRGSLAWATTPTQETGMCLGSTVLIHPILVLETGVTETLHPAEEAYLSRGLSLPPESCGHRQPLDPRPQIQEP